MPIKAEQKRRPRLIAYPPVATAESRIGQGGGAPSTPSVRALRDAQAEG